MYNTHIEQCISDECDTLKDLLIAKNRAYGNSALSPVRVFSKASTSEQLLVRMDDKLSRISNRGDAPDESMEDTIRDLAGYLVLYMVQQRALKNSAEST